MKYIVFLLLLTLINCGESTTTYSPKGVKEEVTETLDDISSTSNEEQISEGEIRYVNTKSNLNYRDAPDGEVLGKFKRNEELIVVHHSNVFKEITDEDVLVKGEWVGVLKEIDTVYVFDAFLSKNLNSIAQDGILSQEYYEGILNNDIEVSMYLKIYEDDCPRIYADAVYNYKNNTENNWTLLIPTFSEDRKQFTFVEFYTGEILLLHKETNSLKGLWISSDGEKQFKIELHKIEVNNKKIESLEETLDLQHYYAYDC